MKKHIIIIILCSLHLLTFSQKVLDEYCQIAAENNPALKSDFNEYMAALQVLPQVGALPDPTLAFGYFIQPVETKLGPQQAKISASQMFPWFGTLNARENSAEMQAKAKYELFEDAKSKLFYNVKSTYYNLFFIEKAMAISAENIKFLDAFKNLANIKIESGKASLADAYRIQMELNELENQLALLKDQTKVLSAKFNSLLNVDLNSQIQITDSLTASILNDKTNELDSVMTRNSTLAAFDYQIEGLQYRQRAASKEGMPQFNIGIDYTFIGSDDGTMPSAGQDAIMFPTVGIVVPLYRNKYKAKVQEAMYLREAKLNEKSDKENTLSVLFESAWKDYQDALRRTSLYEEQEKLAEKSLAILESDYENGTARFEEFLNMERKRLKYALEIEKAITDKTAAVAFIEYLKGN